MWIINFTPHWMFHLILILGIFSALAGYFVDSLPLKAIAAVLVCFSLYVEGGIKNDAAWEAKIAEEKVKVALLEAKSAETNTVIITKVLTKTLKIRDDTNENRKYIDQYVARDLDSNCRLTNSAVMLINSASQEEVPGSSSGIAQGTSDVKASEFLSVVNENYGTYYQVAEQLKGWQEWYRKQKKIFEE